MAVLPGVLGCRPLQRTIQVRLGTNPAVPRDGCSVARPPRLARMAGRHAHLRGLATAIHEISGLDLLQAGVFFLLVEKRYIYMIQPSHWLVQAERYLVANLKTHNCLSNKT